LAKKLKSKVDTIILVRETTNITVLQIFGYKIDNKNPTGVVFILIEFLPGNVAIDAGSRYKTYYSIIPLQYQAGFYNTIAQVQVKYSNISTNKYFVPNNRLLQVQITSVHLPKIGTIVRNNDGSYNISLLPDIGSLFETATAFYQV
jgi:hypothetical protein